MGILVDDRRKRNRQEQTRAEREAKLRADAAAAEAKIRNSQSNAGEQQARKESVMLREAPVKRPYGWADADILAMAKSGKSASAPSEEDINRREKNRSAQYAQLPEVRAGEIKRAEAIGDTDKVRELTRADDVEAWAKEQVNTNAVREEAQRIYDKEFASAKARGDMSPAVAADKAANAYLDLYRNRAQKVREDTYNFRQNEKRSALENEAKNGKEKDDTSSVSGADTFPSRGRLRLGAEISALINNPEEREKYRSIDKRFGESSETLAHVEAMTDAEKKTIQYFASTGQYDKVEEYYKLLKNTLNKRVQETRNKQTYKEAYEKPVAGAAKNVMASFATPAAYAANAANAVANVFRDEYVPTDTNADAFSGAHAARQTSAGVTERAYDAAGGGTRGELASLLAGTGLSMANFLSKAPLGATGAMLAMGADTAGQTTLDVLERGGTAEQALFLSTAAGAIEALTEKMPLDNLFRTAKDVGKTGIKTTIKSVLKQSGMEATEEMVSELANTALDIAVMRDKSEYRSYISELEASGMSRAEAEREAFFQYFGKNILLAGAGGAISGAAMGGGASAVSGINTNINRKRAGGRFIKTEYSDKITNKQIRALDAVGKRLGVKISIGAPTGTGNGAYDGYYKNGEIVIAQDAKNPLEVVLSHEVAHHLKTTSPAEYNAFLELAMNAETQSATGKVQNDASERDEVAARFTRKLVNDTELFRHVAQSDRGTARKLLDGVKNFTAKVKSAFSSENAETQSDTAARDKFGTRVEELERATYLWEKMLSDTEAAVASGNKNTAGANADGGKMYSLKSFEDGRRFVDVETDQHLFDGLTDNQKGRMATKIIKERFAGKVVGRDNRVFVNGRSAAEYGHPSKKLDAPEQNAKMRAATELDNLIDAGTNFRTEPDGADGHIHPEATGDFKYFDTIFKVENEYFEGRINILPNAKGDRLIDVTRIKNITQDICSSYGQNPKSTFLRDNSEDVPSSDNNIPQSPEKSNRQNSLKTEDLLSPDYGKGDSSAEPQNDRSGEDSYFDETQNDAEAIRNDAEAVRNDAEAASAPAPEKGKKKPKKKKDKDGKVVSQVRTNTMERSGIFSEEELLKPELAEENFKYKPVSEDETRRKARERVEAGREEALEHIKKKEDWEGTDTDTAFELLKLERADAAESGNWVRVGEIARLIQKRATKAGQEIQAHAKYTRTAEKVIIEAADQIEKSSLVSADDLDILRELAKRFVNDNGELDTERMDKALTDMMKDEPKARRKRVRKVFREIVTSTKEKLDKQAFLTKTDELLSNHMEDTVRAQKIMQTVSGAADLIYSIKEDGKASKEKLIELIKRQAATRGHKISKANEARLLGEDFEFLYDTAEKQLRAITEDYIPRSLGQKVSTIQSLGQLLQVPTYLTNIISNRAFGVVDKQTANAFGILFDRLISFATKQKTVGYEHTFGHGIREAGKKQKNRAKINASLDIKSEEAGRYGTGKGRTFKSDESRWRVTKFLSNVEKLLAYELNVPDEAQKGRILRSVTESLIPLVESGNMTLEEATETAVYEARYRTFQDDNLPSKIVGELKKVFNLVGTKDFGAGDFICKYTQVAGALIERTLEYSPAGYIKGIYNLGQMAAEGISAKKQRQAALAFARGTMGTGLIAISTLLSHLKIIFRDDDEKDDNIRALNSAEGIVGTKINLSAMGRLLSGKSTEAKKGDQLLSVDRFEPFNMFFTVGAEIAKAENKSIGNIALISVSGAVKSIRELSIIQTIDEFFTMLEYSDDSDQIALASELAIFVGESTIGSFIPSAVRRGARAFDNNYRDAYADDSEIKIALRTLGSSIPGVRNTLPKKLDNFGHEKTYTDNPVKNFINAMAIPFELSSYKKSDVSRELERVRKETGSRSIYPPKSAPYSVKYDGEKYILHAEARERYQKMRGNTYYRLIFEALNNERYKKLNADQQAAVLEKFKEYATDKAKEEYFKSVRVEYKRDATAWDADEEKLEGGKISDFYIDQYAASVQKKRKTEALDKARREAIEKKTGTLSEERYNQIKRAITCAENKNDALEKLKKLGYKQSVAFRIYTAYKNAE